MRYEKLNVLYLHYHSGNGGGCDTYIHSLIHSKKINAFVACPSSSHLFQDLKNQSFKNLFACQLRFKTFDLFNFIQTIFYLKKLIQCYQIDIVHTNGSSDNKVALFAKFFSKKNTKIIYTKHNAAPIKRLSQWRMKRFNDAIIFVANALHHDLKIPPSKKIFVIKNGVNIHHWKPIQTHSEQQKITLISNAGTAICKGWHYLIHAFQALSAEEQAHFKIKIFGALPTETIFTQLCPNPLSQQIEFLGFSKNTLPTLQQADIGFVLSTSETISFACREMMSCGLPVIVNHCGGLPENVTHEHDGWIVNVKQKNQLVALLKKIIQMDKSALHTMQNNAREKAVLHFSSEQMIDETEQLYFNLMQVQA